MSGNESVSDWLTERCELSRERISVTASGGTVPEPFDDYFTRTAEFIMYTALLGDEIRNGVYEQHTLAELEQINRKLYEDILPGDGYESSYANPVYSVKTLGSKFGPVLSWLTTEVRGLIPLVFQGRTEDIANISELFIEICNAFESGEPDEKEVRGIIYWYVSDYADQTVERKIRERLDPSLSFYRDIIMDSDLSDPSYLYRYGEYISDNERGISKYLSALSQDEIDAMARTFTDGYIRGFEIYKIDLSPKKTVWLRGNIGFERVLRSVINHFKDAGLDAIVTGDNIFSINKTSGHIGLVSTPANPQYDYDHRADQGLYLDRALCERICGVTRTAYASLSREADEYAGPALMDVFGEVPFEPEYREECVHLSDKQQKLSADLSVQLSWIMNQYIDSATTSFSIIAWPVPSIGSKFPDIMKETAVLNNLDNDLFRSIQQKMIDAMDGAEYVSITGAEGNDTDMRVSLWQLKDPDSETVFENCCADVNIPAGEVFTSPVLEGTEGLLHVSRVYLNDLCYRDLRIWFKDGCVTDYDCGNFDDDRKNRDFLKQNLMQGHDTLPLGEFAIGTNTAAYAMAKRYDIEELLPILIMEKTGPHFALGDTCYNHSEDHKVYNPDGREIVARENSFSALRDTDPEHAYFNVHTDITIPYEELGAVTVHFADGHSIDIIKNGRFVLDGTQKLNEALEEI